MYDESNRLNAWRRVGSGTAGSSWFSTEEGSKGAVVPGQLGDLAVLSANYFSVPDEEIKRLESSMDAFSCLSRNSVMRKVPSIGRRANPRMSAFLLVSPPPSTLSAP